MSSHRAGEQAKDDRIAHIDILGGGVIPLRYLIDLLSDEHSNVTLDWAALDAAKLEYPDLEPEPFIARLDEMAAAIASTAGTRSGGRAFVQAAVSHLSGKLGFRGNDTGYYDIRNSCLNDVLDRRIGIPITLSLVYLEIARRLSRPIVGIGLPGHFLVQYDGDDFSAYIDPFHAGALLDREACVELIRDRIGEDPPSASFLPCTARQIVARMLHNMKGIYVRRQSWEKARQVSDLLLLNPSAPPGEFKQRGVIHLQLRQFRAAMADFEQYLRAAPDAGDRADVAGQIEAIHRYLAMRN